MPIGFLPRKSRKHSTVRQTSQVHSNSLFRIRVYSCSTVSRQSLGSLQLAEEMRQIVGIDVACDASSFEIDLQKHLHEIQRDDLPSNIPPQSAMVVLGFAVGVVHLEVVCHSFEVVDVFLKVPSALRVAFWIRCISRWI